MKGFLRKTGRLEANGPACPNAQAETPSQTPNTTTGGGDSTTKSAPWFAGCIRPGKGLQPPASEPRTPSVELWTL